MSLPILPLELHQLIVNAVGDEAVAARRWDTPYLLADEIVVPGDLRDALRSCSLVCKHWHALTLQYTFYGVAVALNDNRNHRAREDRADVQLLELLKANPLIKRRIWAFRLFLSLSVSAATVEDLCCAIAPVEIIHLALSASFELESVLPRPSPLDALRPLLSASSLRHLLISTLYLPTRLLGYLCHIQSLTLEDVETVVADHASGDNHVAGWSSCKLERLNVQPAGHFLAAIGSAPAEDSLSAFFEKLKNLEILLHTNNLVANPPWRVALASWHRLETLTVHWGVLELNMNFLRTCKDIPWESLQRLRSLTFDISCQRDLPTQLFNADVDPSTLILAGPSHLPDLQDLHLAYYSNVLVRKTEQLYVTLDAICLYNFSRTIEDQSTFPSLQIFHAEVKYIIPENDEHLRMDKNRLVPLIENRLPAIFGEGGRKELHGWMASATVIQRRVWRT